MKVNIDFDSLSISFENMTNVEFERLLEIVNEVTEETMDGDDF